MEKGKNDVFWPFGWRSKTPKQEFSTYKKVDMDFRYM
jgi:hypothetical protein